MPETFSCDTCGKPFPTEGDMRQHTETMHASGSVGGYKQAVGGSKDEDPTMPRPPRTG